MAGGVRFGVSPASGGWGEVGAVVLADAEEIDAQLVGEHRFADHVPDDLRMRQGAAAGPGGDVAERVESEFERLCHWLPRRRLLLRWLLPPSGCRRTEA